ncbi:MAG: hypothetical protein JHD21_11865, partial [Nocardioides sp.]|nr:hypothetical protein [Nocardioides sp.]
MDVAVKEPLEAAAVRETVEELHERIGARFPERGLRGVAGDLLLLIDQVQASNAAAAVLHVVGILLE